MNHRKMSGWILSCAVCGTMACAMAAEPASAPAPTGGGATVAGATSGPADKLLEPTLISLHLKDAKPEAVFAELAKASECEFHGEAKDTFASANAAVTIDIDKQPFWAAVREAGVKTGLYPARMNDSYNFVVGQTTRGWLNGAATMSGGTMIVANQIRRSNSVWLGKPDETLHDIHVSLSILPEPKLRCSRSSRHATIDEATDDKGTSLISKLPQPDMPGPSGPYVWAVNVALQGTPTSTKIAKLKGSVKLSAQTENDPFEVADITHVKDATKNYGNRRVIISELKKTDDGYELKATMSHAATKEDAAEALKLVHPADVHLTDANGVAWMHKAALQNPDKEKVELTFRFVKGSGDKANVGEPAKLVWTLPGPFKEITVPFEFTDLVLP